MAIRTSNSRCAINDKFDESQSKECFKFLWIKKISLLGLLRVKFIVSRTRNSAITAQSFYSQYGLKKASLEECCSRWTQVLFLTALYYLFFLTSKNKDLNRIMKYVPNVVWTLKVLWSSKFIFSSNLESFMLHQSNYWNFCIVIITCIIHNFWTITKKLSIPLLCGNKYICGSNNNNTSVNNWWLQRKCYGMVCFKKTLPGVSK